MISHTSSSRLHILTITTLFFILSKVYKLPDRSKLKEKLTPHRQTHMSGGRYAPDSPSTPLRAASKGNDDINGGGGVRAPIAGCLRTQIQGSRHRRRSCPRLLHCKTVKRLHLCRLRLDSPLPSRQGERERVSNGSVTWSEPGHVRSRHASLMSIRSES
jgi:hypothetical protein